MQDIAQKVAAQSRGSRLDMRARDRRLSLCACLLWLALAMAPAEVAAEGDALRRDMPFPISTGVSPTLKTVEVHRVTSTGLIDVAVILETPHPAAADMSAELLELGELCLRYGTFLLAASVPPHEHARLRVLAIFYRSSVQGGANEAMDRGFAFIVQDSRCTLALPFPEHLAAEATRRAG